MSDLPVLESCSLVNGQKVAWRQWGTGEPLVMLHGWSMSSVVFSEVAQLLSERYAVFCPDLPGHGGSDACGQYSLSAMATVVSEWAEQLSLPPFTLLGWSLGGQVALQLALEKPVLLTQLLLVATTPCFCQTDDWSYGLPNTQVKALSRNVGRCYEKTMGDFFHLQFAGENIERQRYREIIRFAVRPGRLPDAGEARAVLDILSRADLRSQVEQIELATHILHGENDQIIPVGAGHFLAESLPNAQLQTLPGIGHAPFFSCPQQAIDSWLEFLK